MGELAAKRGVRRVLNKLLNCRKGTAEIIGSVMFLLIMMFFFTNVFLWHDNATREMDGVLAEKMNSPVSIRDYDANVTDGLSFNVTNNGGVSAELFRLWVVVDLGDGLGGEYHRPCDFRLYPQYSRIEAGDTIPIPIELWLSKAECLTFLEKKVTFKFVTTSGNMAAVKFTPYD
jgi:hypothetical protein